MNEIFTIGDFCFRIVCDEGIEIPDNFLKFRGDDTPAYTYTLRPRIPSRSPEVRSWPGGRICW